MGFESFAGVFAGTLMTSRRALLMLLLTSIAAAAWAAAPGDAALGDHTKAGESTPTAPSPATTTTGQGATTTPADAGSTWIGLQKVGIDIGVFVVPIILGNFLAKRLRMPDYGWKFSIAIGTLLAAAVIIAMGEIKLGPDLSGGITLIYEVQRGDRGAPAAPTADQN
jgi:hypothetical protein